MKTDLSTSQPSHDIERRPARFGAADVILLVLGVGAGVGVGVMLGRGPLAKKAAALAATPSPLPTASPSLTQSASPSPSLAASPEPTPATKAPAGELGAKGGSFDEAWTEFEFAPVHTQAVAAGRLLQTMANTRINDSRYAPVEQAYRLALVGMLPVEQMSVQERLRRVGALKAALNTATPTRRAQFAEGNGVYWGRGFRISGINRTPSSSPYSTTP